VGRRHRQRYTRRGNRLPHPNADDDGDGRVDEDWLDGHDNDADRWIDEDFAAISDQMFSCWYTDDQPGITQIYPQHTPMHLKVRQESYQWENDRFDDAVAIDYTITNTGSNFLEDVYLGFFIDADCGSRNTPDYWQDDATGYIAMTRACTDIGSTPLQVAYAYDRDGDGGQTPGWIGVVLLDHTTDGTGQNAPSRVSISTYANFSGSASWEEGGHPTNDFERYETMSSETIERDATVPRDFSFLVTVGPFPHLQASESLKFTIALVMGAGRTDLLNNAASAKLLYEGNYYNVDGDPNTGVLGRETRVEGPAQGVVIDACDPDFDQPIDIGPNEVVWTNADCEDEIAAQVTCAYDESQEALYRTGINGRETQVHWTIPGTTTLAASIDIKPGSCPNPFNVTWFDNFGPNGSPKRGGVISVAVAGGDGFDVQDIDMSTVTLLGVPPLRGSYEDETAPVNAPCDCPERGPDGVEDLVMKFSRQALAYALPSITDGDIVELTLSGIMNDGTPFEGADCVRIQSGKDNPNRPMMTAGARTGLATITPNPFNPSTQIAFSLERDSHVRLSVYDVSGARVATLVDASRAPGDHVVTWEASGHSSGIYFVRFEAGAAMETRKIVLLK